MSVTIVVPCYNEAENVPRLAVELGAVAAGLPEPADLLFVDDGSRDATADLLEAQSWPVPARVIRHGRNIGLGAAIRTGFANAGADRVVVTDADASYDFTSIPVLLALLTDGVDVVSASPYHPSGGVEGVPPYRLVLSRGASTLYRVLVSPRIFTWTGMYRVYRAELIRRVPFDSDGFLSQAEILINAVRMGARVVEYPTVLRVRRYGQSKARLAQIVRAHLRFAVGLILHRRGPVSRRTV